MQHRWQEISPGTKIPELVNVFVEVPVDSIEKYELDKKTDIISIDRTNNNSEPFPFAYGFIPQTLWDDGDSLDVVLLTNFKPNSGSIVEVRPVAIMKMMDGGKSDDKIIGVANNERNWAEIKDLADLDEQRIKEITNFFNTYKPLKSDEKVKVEILGFENRSEAYKAINRGIKLYKDRFDI